ncbi:MAG TPA: leucine-rich repeat domain-containing protein [Candidatus Borkfalkia faecigallinarum]|uniref:Leucine-rich repeat domain-containing protein n=1 Tax=Candidatus Borkfalkia faecigallinarum TaxID=2838509 RepID=A0A9D1VU74_9FIRM|nr:leucine-rich repeat domain-containing protein [Candidatus Borkfalkia faecigallinarum]
MRGKGNRTAGKTEPSAKGALRGWKLALILGISITMILLGIALPVTAGAIGRRQVAGAYEIAPGDSHERVVELLGEPDAVRGDLSAYRYAVSRAGELLGVGGLAGPVYAALHAGRAYFVTVDFAEEGVCSVLLDTEGDLWREEQDRQQNKRLRSCRLLTEQAYTYERTDIFYAATYWDGSYYMGVAQADFYRRTAGIASLEWEDPFGNACRGELSVANRVACFFRGDDWYLSYDRELHFLSDAGIDEFSYDAYDIDCSLIQHVCFDYEIEEIPSGFMGSFQNDTLLEEFVVPDSVRTIGDSAFFGCTTLTRIVLPEGLERIGVMAFVGCDLREVRLPSSLREIGYGAFEDCAALEKVVVPAGVAAIGSGTFEGCSSLTEVELSEGLQEIGSGAFADCVSLRELRIPASVSLIETGSLQGCAALESVVFSEPAGWSAHLNYSQLCNFSVEQLSDPATAARLLCKTYVDWKWFRA